MKFVNLVYVVGNGGKRRTVTIVVRALATEHCSYLVAFPESANIKTALNLGWEVYDGFDKNFLEYVVKSEGVVFKLIGKFDDLESGFVGVGIPELIRKLMK